MRTESFSSHELVGKDMCLPDAVLVHALKSIHECVSITDEHNRILYVNDAFVGTYGYSAEELSGQDIAVVLSPRNPTINKDIVAETLRGGWEGELFNRKKDGTEFPVFLSTSVVRDQEGKAIAMIGVARDITASKLEERHQREQDARFRNIVEGSKAVLINISPRGIITYANEAACEALHCSAGKLEGMHYLRFVHPEDRVRVHDTYLRQIRGEMRNTRVEFRYVNTLGVMGWLDCVAHWLEVDGKIAGISGIGQEISDYKKAEYALRESEELYKTLVRASPDAITQTDVEGRITFVSPGAKEMFGHGPEEDLRGRHIWDWVAPEERERVSRNLQHLLATGEILDREFLLVTKDGTPFHAEVGAALIPSADGHPKGTIITTRNVNERKKADRALQMFRHSIDQASDAVFWFDRDGTISYANDEACRSLGYSRSELLRMNLWDVDPTYPRVNWDQRWDNYERNHEHQTTRLESFHRRKDGSRFPVEVLAEHLWIADKPHHVAYVRDISARTEANAALRKSEAQLSQAVKLAHL
ncbi:MAG TPA: PAS domain S-box protein, partial [Bacteroidota bacterium]|nr:PAS domain S-box protein [Bacteroidota bacterium]